MYRKLHRWSGLLLGPVVFLWFVSGMVMMYAGHPQSHKTAKGRLPAMAPLTVSDLALDFGAAWAAGGLPGYPEKARLNMLMGRPAYFFRIPDRPPVVVWADTGERLDKVTPEMALQSAASYIGQQLKPIEITRMDTPDQWTVGTGAASWHWPLYRISLNDGARTQVYVSQRTGEVCQVVDKEERLVSWFGFIPHWLYVTCLRQHRDLWRQAILWLSGAGTLCAMLGMGIGCWYFRWKGFGKGRHRRSSPFMGIRKLHHLTGLMFGMTTIFWIFSGMLSLSPFHWCSSTAPSRAEVRALAGGEPTPSRFSLHPASAVETCRQTHPVHMITLTLFNQVPYYLCWESSSQSALVRADGPGHAAIPYFSPKIILEASENLVPPECMVSHIKLDDYDIYCADRKKQIRLPIMRITTSDPQQTRYYIDMSTGTISQRYDRSARLNRWLYRFLHSMDIPFFIRHWIARDMLMWITLIGGTTLTVTGIWSWTVSFKRPGKSY